MYDNSGKTTYLYDSFKGSLTPTLPMVINLMIDTQVIAEE